MEDKEKDPIMHIIQNPLLTEDGFLNEACMNELKSVLNSIEPDCIRLMWDKEWSEKRWTFKHEIVAALAKWAVRQSTYPCPTGLDAVLGYLDACLTKDVPWSFTGNERMAELSLCDISKLLHDSIGDMQQIKDWNTPKKNWRNTNFEGIGEAERHDPDYGFVDIDALFRNVCLDIRAERRVNSDFNKRFEEEWKNKKDEDLP
jgi:hypothetical protein